MSTPDPPTLVVRGGDAIPLAILVVAGCALGYLAFTWLNQGNMVRAIGLVVAAAIAIGIAKVVRLWPRPVQLLIVPHGIEVVSQHTGLIRWEELVYVSLFTTPPDGADGLAIFVNEEAARRLPARHNMDLPEFANVTHGTKYIVLYGRDLEYPLRDVLAEIEARRRGQSGPLTKRVA